MEPKPVQKPGIPILMGGSVDAVLKRSAKADGWIAGSRGTPETFHAAWQKVQAYARAIGKDPATQVWKAAVHRRRRRPRTVPGQSARLHPRLLWTAVRRRCHRRFWLPKECAAKIQDFIDAGAKSIVLAPIGLDVRQLTRLAKEVMPALR